MLAALAVLGLLAPVWSPTPVDAADPPGSTTPSGYTVRVEVTFTGSAAPGGGSTRTVTVAPTCWWQAPDAPYTDAVAMLAWYDEVTGGQQTRGVLDEYGPRRVWEEAAAAEAAGTADTSWYRAYCLDPQDYDRYDAGSVEETDPVLGDNANFVTYYYRAFPAGVAPPAPLASPAELARVAREAMEIPKPVTDRNPRIRAAGGPTLVGLPTWFWVRDPQAVGGAAGTADITATLDQVWATVTARTGGLHLRSPAGDVTCTPAEALREYRGRATETSPCAIAFERSSLAYPGGFPVAASTAWQADWVGSDGTTGDLDPLALAVTVQVPVAEVQNIVVR